MRTVFSYYGGKGVLSKRLPTPLYPTITEPFAGAASYSARHWKHDIKLMEMNKDTYSIWEWLQSNDLNKIINSIPETVEPGAKINSIIKRNWPKGAKEFIKSAANLGVYGTYKNVHVITKFGANNWNRNTVRKLKYWKDKIKHWDIKNGDYRACNNTECTWFIDPPYQNNAGDLYKIKSLDYDELYKWVNNRKGQVIICENENSKWIQPFIENNIGEVIHFDAQGKGLKRNNNQREREIIITWRANDQN